MKPGLRLLFCVFSAVIFYGTPGILRAQKDSLANKVTQFEKITRTPFSTQNSQRFDILFTRGFLIAPQNGSADSIPVNAARSGTNVLALGFNIPLSFRYSIDIQPGMAFFRMYFYQKEGKTFPDTLKYEFQKLRISYFELPICFRINLSFSEKNNKKIPVSFFQIGGSAGLRLGSSYKYRQRDVNDVITSSKHHFVEGVEPLRYTVFTRFVYKSLGINLMYRLSPVFDTSQGYSYSRNGVQYAVPRTDNSSSLRYPKMGDIEFGLTIII